MLQAIRDKTTGWITWFVVGLIVVPFAFWGIESFNTGGGDPVVVEVGSQEIRQSQFQAAYQQRYQQLQQMMGERFRADLFDQKLFREAVLNDLKQESMLRQYSHDAGYRATDATLVNYLSTIPAFQVDGKFDTEAYKAALSRVGRAPEVFEAELRDSLTIEQMREAVVNSAFVTPAETAQAYRLREQQRWLSYAVFDSSGYAAKVNVTDEQMKSRYESDKAKYMAPERIKLAYVELALDTLPKVEAPATDVLKVIYDAEKDSRFSTAEERRARHILVNFGADKDAARKKIEGLAAQITAGQDFAAIAQANSDDPGSKGSGGDLSWVRRGQMVEKFEKALFALGKAGEVSQPVETEFGWHLIRLEEIKPAMTQAFESAEVQRQLIELYQTREQQRHFQEKSEKLEQLAFENNASLEIPAKELGLSVQTTDWITRAGGPGIASIDAVKQAAFSAEVVKDDENSKPLPAGDNRVVVIRKAAYEAPRQKTFEEVVDAVRADTIAAAARAQAQADAAEVLKQVKAGTPLADAVKARGVELQSPGLIKRNQPGVDRAIVDALFKLPRPTPPAAQFKDVSLANGNVAVIGLSAVQDGVFDPNAGESVQAQGQLREVLAGNEFAGFRKQIEDTIKVKVVNALAEEAAPQPEF